MLFGSCHLDLWWWRYDKVNFDDGKVRNFEVSLSNDRSSEMNIIAVTIQLQSTHRGDQNDDWVMSFGHLVVEI